MATVKNPTQWPLFSHPLRQSIDPGQTVRNIDQALAEEACASGVFELGADRSAAPERRVTKKGSKLVEETGAPKAETR
jgi:hypothetical protein